METIKKLLYDEVQHKMPDELYDLMLESATEVRLKNKEPLIAYGRLDSNVYVQKSGITRLCYFDGIAEKTYGFATPGSVIISYHCYFLRRPSFYQFESCGESVALKLTKEKVTELIARSHHFAQWFLSQSLGQLYFTEVRNAVINGMAKERFQALVKNRPDIIGRVPMKTIASYLGVTPAYLCRLKKKLETV